MTNNDRFQQLFNASNLTQSQIANSLGITQSAVNKILNRKAKAGNTVMILAEKLYGQPDNANGIFVPHELKTIEVDTKKKVFKINGEDFGKDCAGFTITCHSRNSFDIRVEVDATVKFVSIRGKCATETEYPVSESLYSGGE